MHGRKQSEMTPRPQKMPRFLEGKAGAKSLYNQFGGAATECHIFCKTESTMPAELSQAHFTSGSTRGLAKKNPAALEVVSCGAIISFPGGFEEGCLDSPATENRWLISRSLPRQPFDVFKIQNYSREINVVSRKS
jgi:hypothetical protein